MLLKNIVVSRNEVDNQNISLVLQALRGPLQSPDLALSHFETIDIAFHGYADSDEELFEIQEVRKFVQALDEQFPYWLFFLNKRALGLQCITHCFLPPFLTDDARQRIFPARIDDLLTKRWFPAMNQICAWVGLTQDEIESLSERSVTYLLRGPVAA